MKTQKTDIGITQILAIGFVLAIVIALVIPTKLPKECQEGTCMHPRHIVSETYRAK